MLERRHELFFLLRSFARVHSCCQLSSSCRNYRLQNVLSSFAVPVSYVNCQRIDHSNVHLHQPHLTTRRFYTALHHNLDVRALALSAHSSRATSLLLPCECSRLLPNVRWLTLSPKAIVEASPLYIQPYLRLIRLDRPIGTWLLFLPSAWSLTLATPVGQVPDPGLLALFALGAFMMRSAGCTINDMWDKDFDIHVERTKDRPIACGEITRLKAFAFLGLPLSSALAILLSLNWNTNSISLLVGTCGLSAMASKHADAEIVRPRKIRPLTQTVMLGFAAMIPVIVYPLMKRITYWPQAFLGITFNYGALMAWSAVRGCLDWSVLPLYLSCFAWTVVYDSIYAFQDKKYDTEIGVKSTAQRFDAQPRLWMTGFASVMSCGLVTTGWLCQQAWPYYLGVSLFAAHLGHQICTVDVNDPKDCGKKFRSNRDIGLAFWLLILASSAYSYRKRARQDATDAYLADDRNVV